MGQAIFDLDDDRFPVWQQPALWTKAAAAGRILPAEDEAVRITAADRRLSVNCHQLLLGPQKLLAGRGRYRVRPGAERVRFRRLGFLGEAAGLAAQHVQDGLPGGRGGDWHPHVLFGAPPFRRSPPAGPGGPCYAGRRPRPLHAAGSEPVQGPAAGGRSPPGDAGPAFCLRLGNCAAAKPGGDDGGAAPRPLGPASEWPARTRSSGTAWPSRGWTTSA